MAVTSCPVVERRAISGADVSTSGLSTKYSVPVTRRISGIPMSNSCRDVSSHITPGLSASGKSKSVPFHATFGNVTSAFVQLPFDRRTLGYNASGHVISAEGSQHALSSVPISAFKCALDGPPTCGVSLASAEWEHAQGDVQAVEDVVKEDSEEAPIAEPDIDDLDELSGEVLDEVPDVAEVHVRRHRKSTSHEDGGHRRKHRNHRKRRSSRVPVERGGGGGGGLASGTRHHHERKSSRLKESRELLADHPREDGGSLSVGRSRAPFTDLLSSGGGVLPGGEGGGGGAGDAAAARKKTPVFEMVVAGLIVVAGMCTLLVSVVIGGETWTIVGSSCMGLGSLFLVIGVCWYLAKTKDDAMHDDDEGLEVRVVDVRQLADLIRLGVQVRPVK